MEGREAKDEIGEGGDFYEDRQGDWRMIEERRNDQRTALNCCWD